MNHLERLKRRLENSEPPKKYVKVFKDPEKLAKLRELLLEGYSFNSIGRFFGVDHTSIIWHARKIGIASGTRGFTAGKCLDAPPPGMFPAQSKFKVPKYKDVLAKQEEKIVVIDGERINRGLNTYADYVRAENERRRREKEREIVLPETNSPPDRGGEEISL